MTAFSELSKSRGACQVGVRQASSGSHLLLLGRSNYVQMKEGEGGLGAKPLLIGTVRDSANDSRRLPFGLRTAPTSLFSPFVLLRRHLAFGIAYQYMFYSWTLGVESVKITLQ